MIIMRNGENNRPRHFNARMCKEAHERKRKVDGGNCQKRKEIMESRESCDALNVGDAGIECENRVEEGGTIERVGTQEARRASKSIEDESVGLQGIAKGNQGNRLASEGEGL
jgi:hypothetical protein